MKSCICSDSAQILLSFQIKLLFLILCPAASQQDGSPELLSFCVQKDGPELSNQEQM